MRENCNKIDCTCHRCNYRWQYRGNSKFIASCPRCKMTIYIPKMLQLLKQQNKIMQLDPNVGRKNENSLDVVDSKVLTSGSSNKQESYGRRS